MHPRHRNRLLTSIVGILLLAGGLAAYDQDPDDTWHRRIPYQGHLEQNNLPLSRNVDLEVLLFAAPSHGNSMWSETFPDILVNEGNFSIVLGDDDGNPIPAEIFAARESLYLQMVVEGETVGARQRIFGAPFSSGPAGMPPGMVMPFAGPQVPAGWLLCDGVSVDRALYPALFAAIGTAHGTASGSTFNLPDYRGRFLRGVDGNVGRDPDRNSRSASNGGGATGNRLGSVQGNATALPNRAFSMSTTGNHNHNSGVFNRLMAIGSNTGTCNRSYSSGDTSCNEPDLAASQNILASGNHNHAINGGGDNETRPKNAGVYFLIKY